MLPTLIAKNRELIAYFFVACTGVAIQLVVSSLTQDHWGFSFQASVMTGYIAAFIVGFFLTKVFAFQQGNSNNSLREALKFIFVSIISGFITVKGAYYGKFLFAQIPYIADGFTMGNRQIDLVQFFSHFLGMGLSFVVNFLSHKHFTFKPTGIYDKISVKAGRGNKA